MPAPAPRGTQPVAPQASLIHELSAVLHRESVGSLALGTADHRTSELPAFGGLTGLRRLHVRNPTSTLSLRPLAHSGVRELVLDSVPIGLDLAGLQAVPLLTTLSLDFTDRVALPEVALPSITSLRLKGVADTPSLTDFATLFPALTSLHLNLHRRPRRAPLAGAVPRSLSAAAIEVCADWDPRATVALANEILALWDRPRSRKPSSTATSVPCRSDRVTAAAGGFRGRRCGG
ncbi:hypothetical protein [Streptomyces sp. CMB-StM0423]|uniref:hypothetical protein n=1 Tax=Streptomyces sp. CMB-StM0423 TaxID=2059884 RepID=UPI00131D9DEE|nr:hypothetical protein [Streptomyces sp. CMB-StM0423]